MLVLFLTFPHVLMISSIEQHFNLINAFVLLEIPIRTLPDENYSSSGLVRSSSFESIHTSNEINQISSAVNEEERKRQAKLRSRACNDSFRQAVDKSYGQTTPIDDEGRRNHEVFRPYQKNPSSSRNQCQ